MIHRRFIVTEEATLQDGPRGLLDETASGYLHDRIWRQALPRLRSGRGRPTDESEKTGAVATDHGGHSVLLDRPAEENSITACHAVMPVRLGFMGAFQSFLVTGGPYEEFPGRNKAYGVWLSAERAPPEEGFYVQLPIFDHSVPFSLEETRHALVLTLKAALEGETVYIGCCDDGNRMELFLALLGKIAGQSGWVSHSRGHHSGQPVATEEQRCYVREFDEQELTAWLYRQAWYTAREKFVRGWKNIGRYGR